MAAEPLFRGLPPAGRVVRLGRPGPAPDRLALACSLLAAAFERWGRYIPVRDLRAALEPRVSWRTVQRAKQALGIEAHRIGRKWAWEAPVRKAARIAPMPKRSILALLRNPLPRKELRVPQWLRRLSSDTRKRAYVEPKKPRRRFAHRAAGVWAEKLEPLMRALRLNRATRRRLWNSRAGDGMIQGLLETCLERTDIAEPGAWLVGAVRRWCAEAFA